MNWLGLVVAVAAVFVALCACTAISVLSALDGADIDLEPLIVGDLGQLFVSQTFWLSFPTLWHVQALIGPAPGAVMLAIGAGLWCWQRRCGPRPPLVASLALLAGVVPYAVGAIALIGNTDAPATGPWLSWMLQGPLYAALLALTFLGSGLLPRRAEAVRAVSRTACA